MPVRVSTYGSASRRAPINPFWGHPRVISTPHAAGVTCESRERVARMAAESFIAAASGRLPERLVNPQVAALFLERCARVLGR